MGQIEDRFGSYVLHSLSLLRFNKFLVDKSANLFWGCPQNLTRSLLNCGGGGVDPRWRTPKVGSGMQTSESEGFNYFEDFLRTGNPFYY